MNRVVVLKQVVGICHMQVCCEKNTTDEEILAVCNRENLSGTTNGWSSVLRKTVTEGFFEGLQGPVTCADDPGRVHILVAC